MNVKLQRLFTNPEMRVILADDSQLIVDRLQEMLSDFKGVEVVAALKNGKDSLEHIRSLDPDLVIIDINMPQLTGLQVLETIKKENSKAIFIILTFYPTKYFREKAMNLGADYFFSKVDDFEKVSTVVSSLLTLEDKNIIPKIKNNNSKKTKNGTQNLKKINETQKPRGIALNPDLLANRYIDGHLFEMQKIKNKL